MAFKTNYPISGADSLKQRVMQVKSKIKSKMPLYMAAFLQMYPEYNNLQGIASVRNTLAFIKSDSEITEKLETFAATLK